MQDKSNGAVPKASSSSLDQERFTDIDRQYRERLVNTMTGVVRDRTAAEDITARAFAKAWEKRESFRGEAAPTTWIEAIARNEARSYFRQRSAGRWESIDRENFREPAARNSGADELERQGQHMDLKRALAHLPGKYRRVLTAQFVEGRSVREIAGMEGIPIGTALSRIHTAKQHLRDAWELTLAKGAESSGKQDRERSGSVVRSPYDGPDGSRGR